MSRCGEKCVISGPYQIISLLLCYQQLISSLRLISQRSCFCNVHTESCYLEESIRHCLSEMINCNPIKSTKFIRLKYLSQVEQFPQSKNIWYLRHRLLKLHKMSQFLYKEIARVMNRNGISNRVGTAIASATLFDTGLVTPKNTTSVIDKSQLKRERQKEHYTLYHPKNVTNEDA